MVIFIVNLVIFAQFSKKKIVRKSVTLNWVNLGHNCVSKVVSTDALHIAGHRTQSVNTVCDLH